MCKTGSSPCFPCQPEENRCALSPCPGPSALYLAKSAPRGPTLGPPPPTCCQFLSLLSPRGPLLMLDTIKGQNPTQLSLRPPGGGGGWSALSQYKHLAPLYSWHRTGHTGNISTQTPATRGRRRCPLTAPALWANQLLDVALPRGGTEWVMAKTFQFLHFCCPPRTGPGTSVDHLLHRSQGTAELGAH